MNHSIVTKDSILYHKLKFPGEIFVSDFIKNIKNESKNITEYTVRHQNTSEIILKDFCNLMADHGLIIAEQGLTFICPPNTKGFLHKDTHPYPKWNGPYNYCSLLFNIGDSLGGINWYDAKGLPITKKTSANTPYDTFLDEDCTLIGTFNESDTILMRTDIAHEAINESISQTRISHSLRFMKNPYFNEVVKNLKSFVI